MKFKFTFSVRDAQNAQDVFNDVFTDQGTWTHTNVLVVTEADLVDDDPLEDIIEWMQDEFKRLEYKLEQAE